MNSLKSWVIIAAAIIAIGGGFAVVENMSTRSAVAQPGGPHEDRWHYHDGHWSYWNQGDKRWYYTNGNHWFFHDGKAWRPYQFDSHFGRKGFERGAYKYPGEGVEVVVPNHKVYVAP